MKFLTNKALSFFIFFWAVMTEYFHLLFLKSGKPVYHSEKMTGDNIRIYYWDDLVYFWTNETLTIFIILIISIKLWKGRAAKAMMSGICFWYLIEWIEVTLQLAKISDARLYINDGSWLQFSACLTIFILVWFMDKKTTS